MTMSLSCGILLMSLNNDVISRMQQEQATGIEPGILWLCELHCKLSHNKLSWVTNTSVNHFVFTSVKQLQGLGQTSLKGLLTCYFIYLTIITHCCHLLLHWRVSFWHAVFSNFGSKKLRK
jgi:hypothetical protein